MAEDCVDRWNQICFGLISLTALLANVLLFFLVKNRTPQMMLSYRKVLYASCIFDGLAALSHLLISSRPSLEKDIAVMHFDGVLPQILDHFHLLPNGQLAYILAFESATQLNTFSYCFVPFAYRYFHIVWQTNFNKLKFFVLLLVYLSPTTIVAITLPVIAATTYDDMVKFVGERNDGCLRRVPFYDWRFLPVEPTASIAKNSYYPLLLTLLFPFVLCYFLIRIFQKLNEDVKKSSIAAHRMQRQITLTLTAQSVVPIIFVALPCFYVSYNLTHDRNKVNALQVFCNSLSLVPLINPITTILLVKNYRNAIRRRIDFRKGRRPTATSLYMTSKIGA
uniref:G_PROTEIN_RECEP_F1_2 domain-containing protein n=1 Tax=Bursaphelenchus xylophilus TaxID=6326 RepID=A0A1I7S8R2_BURXY